MSSWGSLDGRVCWKALIKGSVCEGLGEGERWGRCVCWLAHKSKEMRDRQRHQAKDRIKQRQREINKEKQRKRLSEAERDRQQLQRRVERDRDTEAGNRGQQK